MKKLCEALSGRISQTRTLTEAEVVERGYTMKGVLGYAEGIFSVCDTENKNHRVYESVLWENTLGSERITEMIDGKLLLGEPDHPETRTQSVIREGSHTVVEARMDGKFIRGTVAVFDNALGRIIWPMLEAGVKLGFSTRGDGDLIEETGGRTRVDPKTYEWHGVDFVLNPSFVQARPESITEDIRKRVRMALTEAAEKFPENQQGLREDVEALLAGPVDESSEDVITATPTRGLELALTQLEEAQTAVSEKDETIQRLETQLAEMKKQLSTIQNRSARMEHELSSVRQRATVAESAMLRSQNAAASRAQEFKRHMTRSQNAQQQFAGTHRTLQREYAVLQSKNEKVVAVVESLRGQLDQFKKQLREAEARATSAERKLKEQANEVPQAVREATLEQYKKLVTNGMEVPAQFKPLLESAGSEADVDTVIESIRDSQASRYPGLPTFGSEYSRDAREALANRLTENVKETETDQDEDDPESEDTRRVLRATMSR